MRLILLLTVVPALSFAAEAPAPAPKTKPAATKPTTTKPTTAKPVAKRATRTAAATTRKPAPVKGPKVDSSDTSWRLQLGYGFTKETLDYSADAAPSSGALSQYAAASNSSSQSESPGSIRL